MAETVDPEFARFIEEERRAQRLPRATRPMPEGQVFEPVFVESRQAAALLRVAARRAAGFFRETERTEVVWVEGGNELAVVFSRVNVKLASGLVRVAIPVRCDQTGPATVQVLFAVGAPDRPAGLYAATSRRPNGPEVIVATWGDALVAFGWHCMLGLVTGISAATGKDTRGNLLVPVELAASERGMQIVPMARHRFSGSTTLKPPNKPVVR